LEELLGWRGNPHFGPFHIASNVLLFAGFILLASSWKVLYQAQNRRILAIAGPYARVRHPQYVAFVITRCNGFPCCCSVPPTCRAASKRRSTSEPAQAEMRHFGLQPAAPLAALTIAGELGASLLVLSGSLRWLGAAYLVVQAAADQVQVRIAMSPRRHAAKGRIGS
jgi:hypothetical protein